MTTPAGPRDPDPIDGQVRQLLWRLRARLVTPPTEERAHADLDRLFAAAAEHAHEAPSAGADAAPGPLPGADRPAHVAPTAGADQDQVAVGGTQPTSLDSRRRRLVTGAVGRVAAAMVMVVTVGTGAVAARDGGLQLPAPFGGSAQDDVLAVPDAGGDGAAVPADPAVDDAPDDIVTMPDAEDRDTLVPEPDGSDAAEGPAPATDDEDDAPTEDDAAPSGDDDAPTGDSGDRGSSSGNGGNGGGTSNGDGASSGAAEPRDSEEDDDGQQLEAPTEEVLAAPEDSNVFDGFGGARPCDEEDGPGCLPDGSQESPATGTEDTTVGEDTATPTTPTTDTATPTTPTTDTATPTTDTSTPSTSTTDTAEDLASRRFDG